MANQSRVDSGIPTFIVVAVIEFTVGSRSNTQQPDARQPADGRPQQQQPANISRTQASSARTRAGRAERAVSPITISSSSTSSTSTGYRSRTTHGTRRPADRAQEGCRTNPICISDDEDAAGSSETAPSTLSDHDDEFTLPSVNELCRDDDGFEARYIAVESDPSMRLSTPTASESTQSWRDREAENNSRVESWRYEQEDCHGC